MNDPTGPGAVLDVWCDFQHPGCLRAEDDLHALRERFGEALEIRRRHFPLASHRHAYAAAQAVEEAFAQGRGEAFCQALPARARELGERGEAVLTEVAAEVGMDPGEVETALVDGRHLLAVDADQAEGQAIGVTGTPTYVIGGRRLDGGASQEGLRARTEEIAAALLAGGRP